MDKLLFGLGVAVIGIAIVFLGLVILIGCIKLMELVSGGREKKKPAAPAAQQPVAPAPVAAVPAVPAAPASDDTLIAVIAAAIAAVWEGETGFVVRRVRRISDGNAWQKAGREEQTYSRM